MSEPDTETPDAGADVPDVDLEGWDRTDGPGETVVYIRRDRQRKLVVQSAALAFHDDGGWMAKLWRMPDPYEPPEYVDSVVAVDPDDFVEQVHDLVADAWAFSGP